MTTTPHTVCPHGMPTPASCLDCMDEGSLPPPPKPEPETANSHAFYGRCDSDCPLCSLTMLGEPIVHTTRGRYVHERCL